MCEGIYFSSFPLVFLGDPGGLILIPIKNLLGFGWIIFLARINENSTLNPTYV